MLQDLSTQIEYYLNEEQNDFDFFPENKFVEGKDNLFVFESKIN